MTMRLCNEYGISLIQKHEGLRLTPYRCSGGVLSIGYGSTRDVTPEMVISPGEAMTRLHRDLMGAEKSVERLVHVPLTSNQFSALCSFVYNVGEGSFVKSTLLRKLNRGLYQEAADEFGKWVYAGGKKLAGLIGRRAEERELFLKGATT